MRKECLFLGRASMGPISTPAQAGGVPTHATVDEAFS
jgi:hypothetical protein